MMRVMGVLSVLALAAGCMTQPEISLNYDENRDFSAYESFVWLGEEPLEGGGARAVPEAALAALETAVRTELADKGLAEMQDPGAADLGVRVVVGLTETVVFDSVDRSVYVPTDLAAGEVDRIGRRRDAVVVARSDYARVSLDPLAHAIDEGVLSIVINDLSSGRQVWSVSARQDMTDAELDGSNAGRVVARLLRDFPPEE